MFRRSGCLLSPVSCLLALLAAAASAQQYYPYNQMSPPIAPTYQQPASRLDRKVDGSHAYNSGRSAEVPTNEASRPHLTIITSDNWQMNARERELVSWFNNNPRLKKTWYACRANWYTSTNPHYRDQLRYKLGEALPIVCVQRPDGEAIVNVTGLSMPRTAGELADMLDDGLNQQYAAPVARAAGQPAMTPITDDCGPDCRPDVQPPPIDGPDLQIDAIPEVIPRRPGSPALLYLAVGVLAAGMFVALVIAACFWRGSPAAGRIY